MYNWFYSIFHVTSIFSCIQEKRSCLSFFRFFLTRWRVLASAPPLSPHHPGGGDGADQDPVPERGHHQRPQHHQETHRGTQGGRAGQGRAPCPGKTRGARKLTRGRPDLILVCLTVYQSVVAKGLSRIMQRPLFNRKDLDLSFDIEMSMLKVRIEIALITLFL